MGNEVRGNWVQEIGSYKCLSRMKGNFHVRFLGGKGAQSPRPTRPRGDFINRRQVNEDGVVSEYHSDLDLLLVLDEKGNGSGKRGRARKRHKTALLLSLQSNPYLETRVHPIFVRVQAFDRALEDGDFFYSEIVKEGRLLFDQGHPLVPPKDTNRPQLRRRKSEDYFQKYYQIVTSFKQTFEFCYQVHNYPIALLMLHQMAEHLMHTLLLVYINQKPRTHDLDELGRACGAAYPEIITCLHHADQIEEKQWKLLQEAYVNARYNGDFQVKQGQAEALGEKVARLQQMIYHACLTKTQSFLPNLPFASPPPPAFLEMDELKKNPIPQAQLALQKQKLEKILYQFEEIAKREKEALERRARTSRKRRRAEREGKSLERSRGDSKTRERSVRERRARAGRKRSSPSARKTVACFAPKSGD